MRHIYETPAYVAVLPSLAVMIDYAFTFFLAGNTAMILQWEASPFVRFAVKNNIMVLYLIAIIVFYYVAAFAVLRILHPTCYYPYGLGLILLVSVTHILGGLSWQFKNAWYSNGIVILSLVSIFISLCLFGYTYIRHCNSSP